MQRTISLRHVALLAGIAALYVVGGKLGLRLGIVHPSVSAVWAPTAVSLAALLMLGTRAWPVVFGAAFLVNVTTMGTVWTALGIATGNTLEGVLGAWAVRRWAEGGRAFDSGRNVVRFAALGALAAPMVSATLGVTSLFLSRYARLDEVGAMWLTWWLGDAAGALLVTPPLLLWIRQPTVAWTRAQMVEGALALATLLVLGWIAYATPLLSASSPAPFGYLAMPWLIWVALRFGPRETATAVMLVSALAVAGALHVVNNGQGALNLALIQLQTSMAVTATTMLVLAAVVAERQRIGERLRELAVTDPLTGLANYRRLIDVLESELARAERMRRGFAVLFFDVDGLKAINDRHGHLVGSRVLCRVAEGIRSSCRLVDTPSRFGGDEFAVVMPEADDDAAQRLARRVSAALAADPEKPPVRVSVGVALHPRDGASPEDLLGAADDALYEMKGTRRIPGAAREVS